MCLMILCTSDPTDLSHIDTDSLAKLPRASMPHTCGTFTPCTAQAPPMQDLGSLKHPLPHTPRTHSLDPGHPAPLRPNTHHIPYSSDSDLGALYILYATCAPKTPCPTHPKPYTASACSMWLGAWTWGALWTLYGSDPVQTEVRVPYRPHMAQILHSLDLECHVDLVQFKPCARWTSGAL